jgi:arylsulfatase
VPIEPPHDDPNWHFSEAIAEKAISWLSQQKAGAPDKPFFMYFAPGACHSPHHVAKEWADKYKGKFDHGWDRQREIAFENQKKLGLVPKGTKLTPRPDSIPSWESRSADEKRLYARMQEVFAGFLEHVDAQVGKVVDAIEAMGLRDDTLIIYVVGDNGPSGEGSLTGTLNNMKTQLGLLDDVSFMLKHIDEIGGPLHENHYPVGWCWAGSSPFQWMKQVASHFGELATAWSCHGPKASPTAVGCARNSTTASTSRRRSSRWRESPSRAK